MQQRRQAGFNLIETVVASMILSGAALALSSISTNAVTGTRLNQHYQMAASVMENKLAQIDFMGIDEFIELGQTEGVIEELEPGYRWEVVTEYEGTDNLYLVSITVSWLEGKRPYQLTAQTMLNGASLLILSETGGP
ncbi:MAG: prepilin-type N-terminal cleavage/methylation domain-containing protein [Phycisphaerales bacterium]|nr:MAG: prepilin-type N-terminal cleavage/methylation domain-containing protein [Phycisphaerales bacterium]